MYGSFQVAAFHNASDSSNGLSAFVPQKYHVSAKKRKTERRYFGHIVPVWRVNQSYSPWTTAADKVRPSPELKLGKDWHNVKVANFVNSEFSIDSGVTRNSYVSVLSGLAVPHHSTEAGRGSAWQLFRSGVSGPPEQGLRTTWELTDSREKGFVILERARQMLSRQRVRDALKLLQIGVADYPDDEQLVRLLRAISPGRVSRVVGPVPDRAKEMAWIRENGHRYRNQWVAIGGGELLACASSLRELLDTVKRQEQKNLSPLLQKIAPE